MSGYGPSVGRLVHICESSEMRLMRKTRPMPPAIGVIAFVALFLGVISGMTLIHENEEVLGAILLIAPIAFVVLLVIWTIRAPK
jgi:hypothetical protein